MRVMRYSGVLVLLCLCAACYAGAQGHAVAVVVCADNPVTNISSADLRKIFAGEKHSWPNGTAVKLVVPAPGSSERQALLRLLRMSDADYRQYWSARVYRGESYAEPLVLSSVGMILEASRVFPGTVAVLQFQDLKPGMPIKMIRVDGKLPEDAGYPLH